MAILGSREQLCIHEDVIKLPSAGAKIQRCRKLVAAHVCTFKRNLDDNTAERAAALGRSANAILDIEELASLGRETSVCPYYLARSQQETADIVFMPYNYIVDPIARRLNKVVLDNAVIIFDEAHNIEGVCEAAASVEITTVELAGCIAEIDDVILRIKAGSTSAPLIEDESSASSGSAPTVSLEDALLLKAVLLKFDKELMALPVHNCEMGESDSGDKLYRFLEGLRITASSAPKLSQVMDRCVDLLTDDKRRRTTGGSSGGAGVADKGAFLVALSGKLSALFDPSIVGDMAAVARAYRMHVADVTPTTAELFSTRSDEPSGAGPTPGAPIPGQARGAANVWDARSKSGPGTSVSGGAAASEARYRRLALWCFAPGFALRGLVSQGVRTVLLTSGTLAPLDSFAAELQLPFPVRLENTHVIQQHQLLLDVVTHGPSGVELNSSYEARDRPEYLADLGNAVVNFCRAIPDGVLVFFASYDAMRRALAAWQAPPTSGSGKSIWERLGQMKELCVEPRSRTEFEDVIRTYKESLAPIATAARSVGGRTGAVMFAVCRGKISEGLDFADWYGRGVIVTGIPFAALKEPRVVLKREYMDENRRNPLVPDVPILSGADWYKQQALRAVNQAIGRVLRHRADYGAILLCDSRFSRPDMIRQLPSWARPYVQVRGQFGDSIQRVSAFFRRAEADASLRHRTVSSTLSHVSTLPAPAAVHVAADTKTGPIAASALVGGSSAVKPIPALSEVKLRPENARGSPEALKLFHSASRVSCDSPTDGGRVSLFSRMQQASSSTAGSSAPRGSDVFAVGSAVQRGRDIARAERDDEVVVVEDEHVPKSTIGSSRRAGLFSVCGSLTEDAPTVRGEMRTKARATVDDKSRAAQRADAISEDSQSFLRKLSAQLLINEMGQLKVALSQYKISRDARALAQNLQPLLDRQDRMELVQGFRAFLAPSVVPSFLESVSSLFRNAAETPSGAKRGASEDSTASDNHRGRMEQK
jgi:Rad3-related DNA helicase